MAELLSFVESLLELEGAATERIAPDGLEVMIPPALQRSLKIPELTRLGFGARLPDAAQRVMLESEWLNRLERVMGTRGRAIRRVLDVENAAPFHPERIVEHTLELTNATYRLKRVTPAWTRYLIMTFSYTAISDEKRDGILRLGLNVNNGSTLDGLLDPLLYPTAESGDEHTPLPEGVQLPPLWETARLTAVLNRALPARIRERLDRFLGSMRRRQERDLKRIYNYHSQLRQQALERMYQLQQKSDLSERQRSGQRRTEQRLQTVLREYQAKVADLRQKYAMSVECVWIQTLELIMPVQRFEVSIRRRKGRRRLSLDWNPLARKLEQAPCEYSYTWEKPRSVCDDQLHLVTPAANGPCEKCGKAYCRACHPNGCPRCGYKSG
ncbi:MAG: hypothetical protein U9Q23_01295 [Candidatus Bipolaricaulota bacterium]|nr:hypothetical protein [Candidatus Bipolaricaulota bacterium]